jgi:hypothetical protein
VGRSKKKRKPVELLPAEDRRAEAITVCWMLTTLITFFAEMLNVALNVYVWNATLDADAARPWQLMADVALFTAIITGLVTLLLTPAVYQFRRARPPTAITVSVILVGLAPIMTLIIQAIRAGGQ